ncbi:hypothetical protein [Flavobacterium faecale]|uniref:hypothetical protein n=1 Tax=Flavobacterium faecale TaxID=1355330 RepID=UPI001FE7385A|nr:hypothetical protein [Flavobacterium faecale]
MNKFLESNNSKNLDRSKYFQTIVSLSDGSLMLGLCMYIFLRDNSVRVRLVMLVI